MNKYNKTEICGLPTVEELRASLAAEASTARERIAQLFDENTFVETCAYAKRSFSDFLSTESANEFEGVICGYGAIDGKLVFAFAEDSSRMGGVIDERHAKKISDLYNLAITNGAPVIGIFDSNGTDIFQGTAALAAYGKIMSTVSRASGVIPQIAYVTGKCIGTSAAIASMFDFVIKNNEASLYVSSPSLTGAKDAQDAVLAYKGDDAQCASYIRSLVSFIPANASMGVIVEECVDKLVNKILSKGGSVLITADHGNADKMYEDGSTKPFTAHTTNEVPFILVSEEYKNAKLRNDGILADIAPTLLEVLKAEKPVEMTGSSLIIK